MPDVTPGLINSSLGSPGWDDVNLDNLPSSTSERVDPLSTLKLLGSSIGNAQAELGTVDEYGRQITPPDPTIPKDTLNQQYGIQGPTPGMSLKFDSDLPESVAQDMYDAKRAENARANAQARSPGGIGSTLSDLGYGFLDPVGIAASVLPVLGEARMGALLGRAGIDLGEGFLGRTALRGATGAVDAAAANLPVTALRYGLSQQEQADYSMADAARDVAYGSLLGAVLHPLAGAARDLFGVARAPGEDPMADAVAASPTGRMLDENPDARASVAQGATAALMDDRPVVAAEHADLLGAQQEADLRRQMLATYDDAQAMRREAAAVPDGAPLDPATQARIEAAEDELTAPGSTLTPGRRADLQDELGMLTQGTAEQDTDLERARSDAQRQGLLIAAQLAEDRVRQMQSDLLASASARQARGEPPPDDAVTIRQADEAATAAPQEPTAAPAEIDQQIQRLRAMVGAVPAAEETAELRAPEVLGEGEARHGEGAGVQAPQPDPQTQADLAAINTARQASQSRLRALAQAAACIARGII